MLINQSCAELKISGSLGFANCRSGTLLALNAFNECICMIMTVNLSTCLQLICAGHGQQRQWCPSYHTAGSATGLQRICKCSIRFQAPLPQVENKTRIILRVSVQ